MGVVWAAVNVELDREVALKLIETPGDDVRVRLLREAKAYARLDHPNVVRIHDVGRTEQGDPFLVMELLTGVTLAERIKELGKLEPKVAVSIARNVARALRAAHDAQIVHRDLKPANIFLHTSMDAEESEVTIRDQVKVLDFGVSKLGLSEDATTTATGVLVGSPAYMSPEQAHGAKTLDGRTDLWALGVVIFEMVAGRRPFLSTSPMGVIAEILERPIPRLSAVVPGVDSRLDDLVARCMTRDLQQRIPSARAVLDALRGFEIADDLAISGERVAPIIPERYASLIEAPDTAPLPEMSEGETSDPSEVFRRVAPALPSQPQQIVAPLPELPEGFDSYDDQAPTSVMNRGMSYYLGKSSTAVATVPIEPATDNAPPINPRVPVAVDATLNLGETTEDMRPTSPMAASSPDPAELPPLPQPPPVSGEPSIAGGGAAVTSSTSALIRPSNLRRSNRDEKKIDPRTVGLSILGGIGVGGILLLIVFLARSSGTESSAVPSSQASAETATSALAPSTDAPSAAPVTPSATPSAGALPEAIPSASATATPTSAPKRPPSRPGPAVKRPRGLPATAG